MRITLPSGTPAISVPRASATTGLVIGTDIWGVRPLFDDLAERLAAEWNMAVCVPEPFPGEDLPMEINARVDAITRSDDRDRLRDLQEAAAATGCERVVMIGFCMGGLYALKAASLDTFDRIVPFYGIICLPESWRSPGQREPLDLIASGHPERVLAVIGEVDPYTPPADVAALEALGVSTLRFPEAAHAFVHDPSRESYRAADAALAWQTAREWVSGA
jgi:carboxymethylenebutenolidase